MMLTADNRLGLSVMRWTLFSFFSLFPPLFLFSAFTLTWTVCYNLVVCRPYSGLNPLPVLFTLLPTFMPWTALV